MAETYAGPEDPIRAAPPRRVAWACGQVADAMVDEGRAAELEAPTPEQDREFWDGVRERLRGWPSDGP